MAKKPRGKDNTSQPIVAKHKKPKLDIEGDLLGILKAASPTATYTLSELQASLKARFKKSYSQAAVKKALSSLQAKNRVELGYSLGIENAILVVMAARKATAPHTHEQIASELKDERLQPKAVEKALDSLVNNGAVERRYSLKSTARKIALEWSASADADGCDRAKMDALSGLGSGWHKPKSVYDALPEPKCDSENGVRQSLMAWGESGAVWYKNPSQYCSHDYDNPDGASQ